MLKWGKKNMPLDLWMLLAIESKSAKSTFIMNIFDGIEMGYIGMVRPSI